MSDNNTSKAKFATLLSWITHEINTPLTAIKGFSDLLAADSDDIEYTKKEKQEFCSIISQECNRLIELVSDINQLDAIISGKKINIKTEEFDVCKLVYNCIEIQKQRTSDKYSFAAIYEKDNILIENDYNKLMQIMLNLLGNAIKYSPKGGIISVTVKDNIESVDICVSDQGLGIDESKLADIFEIYSRVQGDISVDGKGIGLFLVKRLLDVMEGSISVASKVNVGSDFTVTLPKKY